MKGFMAILEAFLAIVLIYIVLSQIQMSIPARYSDTANMDRLSRYSHDIAFSLCDNLKVRRALLNDAMTFDLNSAIPSDIGFHVYVYKNSSNNHLLDSLDYDYGGAPSSPAATSSCLIAGGSKAYNHYLLSCDYRGKDCSKQISSSDDDGINLLQNQNFTLVFYPSENASIVEFLLEGRHNQNGTTFIYGPVGDVIASYNFSTSADEGHVFDLSDFLPSPYGTYNVTIKPNVGASYNYASLNVSNYVYSPRRIVVETWNAGG